MFLVKKSHNLFTKPWKNTTAKVKKHVSNVPEVEVKVEEEKTVEKELVKPKRTPKPKKVEVEEVVTEVTEE